jgi:hypothetical protein
LLTADNLARLITILDPWSHPALAPLRRRVKGALVRVGLRDASLDNGRGAPVTYHSPRLIDEILVGTHLAKIRGMTLGFGPFMIRGHSLLPQPLGIALHHQLQRLADQGMPPFRSMGAHYLVLTKKSVPQSPA